MIYLRKNHHLKMNFATNSVVIIVINHKVYRAFTSAQGLIPISISTDLGGLHDSLYAPSVVKSS